MKKYLLITFFLFSNYSFILIAQTVYEPIGRDIYTFLNILSQKGVINFNDQITPLPRIYIARKVLELYSSQEQLTNLEREEVEYFYKEFGQEIALINGTGKDSFLSYLDKDYYGRLRLFSYSDSLFSLNISPVLGIGLGKISGSKHTEMLSGIRFYGYLGSNIGFSFDYRDINESGETIDRTKQFTPITGGIINKGSTNNIEYSEVHASIAYSWSWGELSLGKEFMQWGYGESGKLVLSTKSPSFPFFRFDVNPVDWLRFNYFHGWLNSNVIDSAASYTTMLTNNAGQVKRIEYRSKYLASHTLTLTPLKGLDISMGESVIYSDKLELGYLIPINFFRLMDHYLSGGNNGAGANSQFFLGISSRNHLKNTHLYGTWFIDEITFEGAFDKNKQRNQFGFQLGGSVTGIALNNLTAVLEYTKIYPFVYAHFIPTQVYSNSGYNIGDWMGNNADRIYGSLNYRFVRGLQLTIWGQYIRKGEAGVPEDQHTQPQKPFLFGSRINHTYLGVSLKYEVTHEFIVEGKFQNMRSLDSSKEFLLYFYYGI